VAAYFLLLKKRSKASAFMMLRQAESWKNTKIYSGAVMDNVYKNQF